ncbi:glycosyltransferase [Rhizobium sp. SL42]|uniref:glycosyltransferase n=1 Tax=Rhizobium sp. SL42 TaxID=2806346 RepID=UPI001F482252|nr:glycosyltransferase [Rhizobium sp. SL42]UJW75684.1 glycosyltransferase [Rhizobium sp. SL42]
MAEKNYLVFVSGAAQTCGVESFAGLLADRLGPRARRRKLDLDLIGLAKALSDVDAAIFNFPVVGWKKKLVEPTLAALMVRLLGRKLVVVLHEWQALDWKRRLVLMPVMLLASRVCFSAPEIEDEFAASPVSGMTTKRRAIVPVPPNLVPPATLQPGPRSQALERQKKAGRLIIGQFGSIYPKKQSTEVLAIAGALVARGHDVSVVFVGSFIKGMDNVERDFFELASHLGISERVTVTGYVATDAELFAIFEQVDVFCYLFPEGLTARRGSVLAAGLSGKPVIVNAPRRSDALAHHGLFRRLIDHKAIHLVGTDADAQAMADAVLEAWHTQAPTIEAGAELQRLWSEIVAVVEDGGQRGAVTYRHRE